MNYYIQSLHVIEAFAAVVLVVSLFGIFLALRTRRLRHGYETAEGIALDRIGKTIAIYRKYAEPDHAYRRRIKEALNEAKRHDLRDHHGGDNLTVPKLPILLAEYLIENRIPYVYDVNLKRPVHGVLYVPLEHVDRVVTEVYRRCDNPISFYVRPFVNSGNTTSTPGGSGNAGYASGVQPARNGNITFTAKGGTPPDNL